MLRHYTLSLAVLLGATALQAQTMDLVMFAEDGSKFTLIVDGDVKNDAPASRVVATGLRNESPVVIVRFEDASIPQIRRSLYLPLGKEYTTMLTTNKKGERVIRPTGEADLGTAAKAQPAAEKPRPTEFVEDKPVGTTGVTQTIDMGGVDQVTTIVVEEDLAPAGTGGENVNISMGVNGVGFNMNVRVDDGMGTTGTTTTRTTTRTTTTTTTTGGTVTATPPAPAPTPVKEPEVYRMPGYTGPVGCGMPMSTSEFADAQKSISGKSFEDSKMTTAKQVGRDRCFTTDQVKGIMGLFSFEDTKLEFAKYAYDRTHDIGNYFKVNDAFTFESSIDDLNKYIQTR
jgi:hypothetical protein